MNTSKLIWIPVIGVFIAPFKFRNKGQNRSHVRDVSWLFYQAISWTIAGSLIYDLLW